MAGDPTGDPYLLPNLTLRNKFGVDDRSELERLEADSVALRFAVLLTKPLLPPYSFETLKTIHGFLFADAYDWAGAPRVTDLAKRQFDDADSDPVHFVRHGLIEPAAIHIFKVLAARNNFSGIQSHEAPAELAALFVALNNLHPFREGNGRTQRFFLQKVAANAGLDLAFDVVTRERMVNVSIAGAMGDVDPAIRLFAEILDADRVCGDN